MSYCKDVNDVHFNPYVHDYSKDYLTFNILSDGYFCFACDNTEHTKTIQYSKNNGEWTNLTSDIITEVSTAITVNHLSGTFTYGGYDEDMGEHYWENNGTKLYYSVSNVPVGEYVNDENWDNYEVLTAENSFVGTKINVVNGDIVNFKGDNATYVDNGTYGNYFNTNCNFAIEGNIMSLINSENFATATTFASSYTFFSFFRYCTGLTSAENLVLPATTLANYCYRNMFDGCTSLTSAPELPATTLTQNCYYQMFQGCTSLTTAPSVLPATTLAVECYSYMFNGCTSLTTAPKLPATTLANYCYNAMFYGCTSLTTAPSLPATTLAENCYNGMFGGCTALNYIKCLATNISASNCTYGWVNGVAATGTFVTPQSTSWTTGKHGIPSGWTRENA